MAKKKPARPSPKGRTPPRKRSEKSSAVPKKGAGKKTPAKKPPRATQTDAPENIRPGGTAAELTSKTGSDESVLNRFTVSNVREVASFFQVSERIVFGWLQRGCPGKPATPGQNNGEFDLQLILAWCKVHVWEPRRRAKPIDEFDDPELNAAVDSPWLEEYRKQRALLAELQLKEKRGQLIDRTTVHAGLVMIAGMIRQFGEVLAREYGNEAAELLNETLTEAELQISKQFERETDGESGTGDADGIDSSEIDLPELPFPPAPPVAPE